MFKSGTRAMSERRRMKMPRLSVRACSSCHGLIEWSIIVRAIDQGPTKPANQSQPDGDLLSETFRWGSVTFQTTPRATTCSR